MIKKIFLIFILINSIQSFSQKVFFNGQVNDLNTTEKLMGVNLIVENTKLQTVSNKFGYFNINLPINQTYKIIFSHIGYQSEIIQFNAKVDSTISIFLKPTENELKEVVVKAKSKFITSNTGFINIPIETLKNIPAIFGEKDILKALAMTPGVTIGNEGTTGLIVRGGTPDQNLILLDDANVYNTAHLFGLVSIFNAESIKNVDLYKAGFPAIFGGRLSSVLDITMNDGNNSKKKVERTIGLISSNMLWQGPTNIKSNKIASSSYLIAARSSYLTPFTFPKFLAYKAGKAENYFNYWLYDINAKLNFTFKKNNQLLFSFYNGNDFWVYLDGLSRERAKIGIDWGNYTSTIRYNHVIHPKLLFYTMVAGSKYHFGIKNQNYEKGKKEWEKTDYFQTKSTIFDVTN